MCRYRHYFFSTCKHQETVLVSYCSNALPLRDAQEMSRAPDLSCQGCDGSCKDDKSTTEGAATDDNNDVSSEPSLMTSPPMPLSEKSSFDTTGSASITTQSNRVCLSSRPECFSHYSPSTTSSHDMDSLPLFGFRQWMSGALAPTPPQGLGLDGQVSTRRSGIREHTNESCDLPRSNDILQHLAESCRDRSVYRVGTDGQRVNSSTLTDISNCTKDGHRDGPQAFDSVEAEIDQLKEDVMRLRKEADKGRTDPKTEQELANDRYLSIRSVKKPYIRPVAIEESAAARLQREHEMKVDVPQSQSDEHRLSQRPPSTMDFPVLGHNAASSKSIPLVGLAHQQRKLSYADAATTGMLGDANHAFDGSMITKKGANITGGISSAASSTVFSSSSALASSTEVLKSSAEPLSDDDNSIIVSPQAAVTDDSVEGPVSIAEEVTSAPNATPLSHGPHFAQPTQSFSRRTVETFRKNATSSPPHGSPGSSPVKSVKAKELKLAVDKQAPPQHRKRKSLPGDWLGNADIQREDMTPENLAALNNATPTSKSCSSPFSAPSPNSAKSYQTGNGAHATDNIGAARTKTKEATSPLREKTSSYMSPTTAATQRAIATLGEKKSKRPSPRTKAAENIVTPPQEQQQDSSPSRSCTFSSDHTSVQFILDHGSANGNTTHSSPAQLHVRKSHSKPGRIDCSAKSPPRVVTAIPSPTAPSKIPKRATHAEQHPERHDPVPETPHIGQVEFISALPVLAKAPATRRISRGHLLKPIIACLDAKGLLDKTKAAQGVASGFLDEAPTCLDGIAGNVSEKADNHVEVISGPIKDSGVNVLAHKRALRRARKSTTASSSTDIAVSPEFILDANQGIFFGNQSSADGAANGLVPPSPTSAVRSRVSSLRATANEFTPTRSMPDEWNEAAFQLALKFRPDEEWYGMSSMERQAVRELRTMHHNGSLPSLKGSHSFWTPPSAPSRLSQNPHGANTFTHGDISGPTTKFVNEYGSPYGVRAGQILKPNLSPGKKTVQWMLQDVDGKETPIKFGRAAPPPHTGLSPATPSISATSDDTSPLKTPRSLNGWTIGSAFSRAPYGWTGGDGKEIRFVGYGPHAERDPNSVVNFNYQGQVASYNVSVPNGFNDDRENCLPNTHVAPKSQVQWAQSVGYQRVPCGNVEIAAAVEQCVPFGSGHIAGFCHDCVGGK